MANRLEPTLHVLISSNQSAFIEGRLLTDNALLAYEINHYIHRKTQGKVGVVGLKVDISKAYDRLEWSFIAMMLQKFAFPTVWIDKVMTCIKTVSYSFLRNGAIFGDVVPHRGIRQGDPISPYLYILCAEGLTALIRKHEECGLLHGCRIANNAPTISHLLFADDCYFFLKATKSEVCILKRVLQRYEEMSGQFINYDKSEIVFSPNTPAVNRMEVCAQLPVRQVQKPGKYLGLPMSVGRHKTEVFGFLVDRVQQRLKGWYNNELSCPGKVTLLSSSTQTLPSFWMSLFLILTTICEEIEREMNAFLWGQKPNGKGVRWLSWSRLCKPKKCGGLGL